MVAVILNGGRSTRMAPYTDEIIPKGLLPVRKNKESGVLDPLLFVQLEQLEKVGIRNVIVVVNNQNENTFNYAVRQYHTSMRVSVVPQANIGQLDAVVTVVNDIRFSFIQDDFLVIDGDTYLKYDWELGSFIQYFDRSPLDILTAVGRVERHDKYAMVTTDEERVLTIEEKPSEWNDVSMLAKIGILGIPRALLPCSDVNSDVGTTEFIAAYLSSGLCAVRFFEFKGGFRDIGTWDDYLEVLERGIYR